jgi:hypothetical protein
VKLLSHSECSLMVPISRYEMQSLAHVHPPSHFASGLIR